MYLDIDEPFRFAYHAQPGIELFHFGPNSILLQKCRGSGTQSTCPGVRFSGSGGSYVNFLATSRIWLWVVFTTVMSPFNSII